MQKACKGFFIAGTDTGVGKTVVSACLVRLLGADYWKPVQSGSSVTNDSDMIRYLTGISTQIHPCLYKLPAPLSPHEAARISGVKIILDGFYLPRLSQSVIVEGAGGILVPLNRHYFLIDLIARLGLPVILVSRSGLGTINHTLLSLTTLRERGITIKGVVMNGPCNQANYTALKNYGRITVKILPYVDQVDVTTIAVLTRFFMQRTILTD